MKKIVALLVVLLLCAAVAVPAMASADFVGSPPLPGPKPPIVDDPGNGPSIVVTPNPTPDDSDSSDSVLPEGLEELLQSDAFLSIADCIVVTSVVEAEEKTTDISQEARDLLLDIYDRMVNGDETLPIEESFSIRELVDVSFKYEACELLEDHGNKAEIVKLPGVTLNVSFDLGVDAEETVVVMTYVEVDGEMKWVEIESVTNNGDGTVSCVFEDICPVAFAVLD